MTNLAYSTGGNWTYAYDARDFVTRRVNPAGEVFTYQYDDAGRLTDAIGLSETNAISGYPIRYRYDKAGNRIRQTEGQKQRDLTFNEDNQLLISARTNILTVRGYVNEAGSRVEAKSNSNTNWIEGAVRFLSVTQSYFEIHGIMTTNVYPSSNTVWVRAFDMSNNVSTSVVHTASSSTIKREYEYDADGNLEEFPAAVQFYMTKVQYSWDSANRLTSMVWRTKPQITNFFLVTTNRVCLKYDGMGRLRQISEYGTNATPTGVVRFVWNGWTLVGELDGSNKLVRTYTYGVDLSGTVGGAAGIGGALGIHSYAAPVTNYYTRHDGKGNVTEVRRYNGTTAASYGYYEFGAVCYQTNTYNQPLRFQSKIFHTSAGISCFGYRWYDPVSGRWLSKDVIGEVGGINLYEYCLGSPLSYSDAYGLWAWDNDWIQKGVGGLLGFYGRDVAAGWMGVEQGAYATLDGLIPFADPLSKKYDKCNRTLQTSRLLGKVSQGLLVSAIPLRPFTAPAQQVVHWGTPLKPGSWVMTGGASARNWVMSGASHLPWNVETATVAGNVLKYPSGWQWVKGLLGQRIFSP